MGRALAAGLVAAATLTLLPLAAFAAPLPEHASALAAAEAHLHETGVHRMMSVLPKSLQTMLESGGFLAAFVQSFLLILACELGDRTFFVAAILAMRSSRIVVWAGALSALALMTIVSAAIGKAFPLLFDKKVTSALAAVLFAFFGAQLLRDWWRMRGDESGNEELLEVEEELSKDARDAGDDKERKISAVGAAGVAIFSPVFVKSFTMTGLAEWGDRSQIATIALAASKNMYGIIIGGIAGHAVCTSIAVIGGRLLATRISERAVTLIGGITFLSFAVITGAGKLE